MGVQMPQASAYLNIIRLFDMKVFCFPIFVLCMPAMLSKTSVIFDCIIYLSLVTMIELIEFDKITSTIEESRRTNVFKLLPRLCSDTSPGNSEICFRLIVSALTLTA